MNAHTILRKSIVCEILCVIVGSGMMSGASGYVEIIDQYQDWFDPNGGGFSVHINEYGIELSVAQSFRPSMRWLTKVDIAILTIQYSTFPVNVSIREDLQGNDLTSITTPPEQIPQDNMSWHTFDFPDIMVVPEQTYYIVVRSNQTGYGYAIGYDEAITDNYTRGTAWTYYDGNWTPQEGINYWYDCAFRTYSEIQPQTPPTISGPHYGKINTTYEFSMGPFTNPEGDSFFAFVDWGDGSTSGWLGPCSPGVIITTSHAWGEPGNYTIRGKLKDIYGYQSDWSAPFFIEIVSLKPKVFLGTFKNINHTEDLIILHIKTCLVFPSLPFFHMGGILVLSKVYQGFLGKASFIGVGGVAFI